jgi:hypothetical protein
MTRSPQCASWTRDPFLLATRWVYRALYPRREFNDGDGDPDASGTMKAVFATLAALARDAAALCEPGARGIAMRFPPHLRLWLYGLLVADPTGRLAQVSAVCPGALTFAFALERSGQSLAGAPVRRSQTC